MSSLCEQLEQEIADRLTSDAFFSDVEVHVDPQKNVIAEVTAKISRLRFLVAPLVDEFDVDAPDLPGPVIRPSVDVGVFENPTWKLKSGVSKTGRQLTERVQSLLHLWQPASVSEVLYSTKPGARRVADKTLNIWSCKFTTEGRLTYQLEQVDTPSATAGALNVNVYPITLHCTTAGAAIFWSDDGTRPTPQNGNLYTAPFPETAGQTVKARAFLAGFLHSEVMVLTT